MLTDTCRRSIRYIRISITDRCNERCLYCLPPEGARLLGHDDILRFEEIEAFMRVAASEGVRHARLTGGEPLVRRGCVDLVCSLAAIPGLADLSLTTNATVLARHAEALREAGLARINVGLPSLDAETYRRLTRGGRLEDALAGLHAALAAGFSPIKLNVVVLRGVNDDPRPFVELTRELPVEVRFIEYMSIGPLDASEVLVPAAEVLGRLERLGPFEEVAAIGGDGPARRSFRLPGAAGRIALIAPVSAHFCDACSRLRLTADGHLRLCLLAEREIDVKPALRPRPDEAAIRELLVRATAEKPEGMQRGGAILGRRMSQIGG